LLHHWLLLKHKKEGHDIVFFFFSNTHKVFITFFVPIAPQKKTTTNYYCLRFKTTIEEGDANKLPLPSSLQQHHRKKQWHIAIVFFFSTTPPQKKKTTMCCCVFLLKHREDKTHKKTTKKIPRKRKELTFKFPLCPLTFGSRFYPPTFALPFQIFSLGIFFFSNKKKKHTHTQRRKNMQIKEGAYLQAPILPSHFWLPLLPFRFCTFVSSVFSWDLLLFK
jgi:hypothetical protein